MATRIRYGGATIRGRFRIILVCLAAGACGGPGTEDLERHSGQTLQLEPLPPEYVLGGDAPEFSLPILTAYGISTDSLALSDLRGRVVLLNFWNTACVPCAAEHETINRVAKRYRERGVQYLGINNGDTPADLAEFERRYGPSEYPHLSDFDDRVGQAYERPAWPLHVAIDQTGKVVWWRHGGPVDEKVLVSVVEDVLNGRPPEAQLHAAFPDETDS